MFEGTNLIRPYCLHLNISKELFLLLAFCLKPYTLNPLKKVEDIGVEPMTLCVQGRCSSQLS
jgi:hypothetical protein